MRITLPYNFAKTVTVPYPDVAPTLQPRFRGFHFFEIEKCIACDMCAKACPVDCIYIEKSGPRKIDKTSGVALGGALQRYAIDYAKCMFCGLCVEPCPTDCIHMGDLHDLSGYDRASMVVEFTELAEQGLQTPQPLWARRDNLPDWARERKQRWLERATPVHAQMLKALEETEIPKAKKPAKKPVGGAKAPGKPTAAEPPAKSAQPTTPPRRAPMRAHTAHRPAVHVHGLLLVLVTGILCVLGGLLVGALVRRPIRHVVKDHPYECGEPAIGSSWVQFDLRFYVVALVFVIFDVEIALFYPWAVVYRTAGLAGLWDMLFFFGVLVIGFLYLWRFGYLAWVRATSGQRQKERSS